MKLCYIMLTEIYYTMKMEQHDCVSGYMLYQCNYVGLNELHYTMLAEIHYITLME